MNSLIDMWASASLQLKPSGSPESTKPQDPNVFDMNICSWGLETSNLKKIYTIPRLGKLKPSFYSMSDCAFTLDKSHGRGGQIWMQGQ